MRLVLREWKRMFQNRNVLLVAVVILILNLALFFLTFVGMEDFSSHRAMMMDRDVLFKKLNSGKIQLEELSTELEQLSIIQKFFIYENRKQNFPDIYETVFAQEELKARAAYPDIAAAFDAGMYNEQETQYRTSVLSAVLDSARYTEQFSEKLKDVFANAEKLSGVSVFQSSGDVDPNLTKTAEDYRRLEGVTVTPGNDAPITALLHYGVPAVLGLIFSCVLVSVTLAEQQYGLRPLIYASRHGRGRLTVCRGIGLLFGSTVFGGALYGSAIILSISLLGGVEPERMIQSVPELFSLTVPMTVREFLVLYLACGIGVQILLTMVVWLIFSMMEQRQMALLASVGLFGVSWLLYRAIPAQSILAVLKYTNPAAGMDFMGVLTRYRNLGTGAMLVEKNRVVLWTGIILAILSAGGAITCGIRRYSISSHSKFYGLIQKWMKTLSVRYHRLIGRLGFCGLECYKVLMMQRGLLLLIILCWLFVQSYPVRDITYVGEAQFLQDFYSEFSGQSITPELEEYVTKLQEKLNDVEAEYLANKAAYECGEMGVSDYLEMSQKYNAFDAQRKALNIIRQKIAYLEDENARGYEAVILDPIGYESLLKWSDTDRILVLIALFGCITLSSLLFPMEQKPGLRAMIRGTRRGRSGLAGRKLILGLVFSAVVFGLFAGIRMGAVGLTYGFDRMTAPAHSLAQFGDSRWNLPIWLMLAGWLASQWLVFGSVSILVCLLTQRMGMVGAIMMSTVLIMGTSVLSLFGISVPTVWNLLEQASLIQSGMMIILMVAGWLLTDRLWSRNGRERA